MNSKGTRAIKDINRYRKLHASISKPGKDFSNTIYHLVTINQTEGVVQVITNFWFIWKIGLPKINYFKNTNYAKIITFVQATNNPALAAIGRKPAVRTKKLGEYKTNFQSKAAVRTGRPQTFHKSNAKKNCQRRIRKINLLLWRK